MSVIFMDSFQHYATADITKKWASASSASIEAASGRRGGNSLLIGYQGSTTITFGQSYPGLIVGFASKGPTVNSSTICRFMDNGSQQVVIEGTADGRLVALRNTTIIGQTAPGVMPANTWFFLEVSVVIHDTAGAVELKVNGTRVLSLTNVDTKNTVNAFVTQFGFVNGTSSQSQRINDLYIIDPAVAPNTTYLGDIRVDAYYPMGDGASSQWTPTPSGAHYANVDEVAPNLTDYVEADVAGYVDLFQMQDLAVDPGASGFFAVQVCVAALKTDAGSRQIKPVVRQGLTNYPGAAKDVSETQKYVLGQFNVDPATGLAWTKTGFDSAEFGVELG